MKYIYLILLFITIGFTANAQDTVKKRKIVVQDFKLNQKTVVKDSTGKLYTYQEWNSLLAKQKDLCLWPDNMDDPQTSFTIVKKAPGETRFHAVKTRVEDVPPAQRTKTQQEALDRYIAALPKPRESEQFTAGQEIESFSTHDLNGNKIKLKDLRGKVVVLNFWFIGCPGCMQEIPELNKLVDTYKDNSDVVFLAIALDAGDKLTDFLKTTPFNYDIIDDGRFIANTYKIQLYPTNVILNKEGKVAFHTVGFAINLPYWMQKTINEALK